MKATIVYKEVPHAEDQDAACDTCVFYAIPYCAKPLELESKCCVDAVPYSAWHLEGK